jgi:hypothetical protein
VTFAPEPGSAGSGGAAHTTVGTVAPSAHARGAPQPATSAAIENTIAVTATADLRAARARFSALLAYGDGGAL